MRSVVTSSGEWEGRMICEGTGEGTSHTFLDLLDRSLRFYEKDRESGRGEAADDLIVWGWIHLTWNVFVRYGGDRVRL